MKISELINELRKIPNQEAEVHAIFQQKYGTNKMTFRIIAADEVITIEEFETRESTWHSKKR